MRASTLFAAAVLLAAPAFAGGPPPSPAPAPAPKGHLVLIGGGIEREDILRKFVELAGGKDAPIVVIPTASEDPESPSFYLNLFLKIGCTNASLLDIKTRADAQRSDFAAKAAAARGVFFGGGDQVRLTDAILGTPVGDAVAKAYDEGAVVGGTSAGTACQSGPMITGEGDFAVVRAGAVEMKRGFGFFRGVIVDQHFVVRQRFNRLLSVVIENKDLLGVGVDEDTAVWVRPDGTFQVLGGRSVLVIDARDAEVERAAASEGKDLLGARGLRLHVLLPGDQYDVARRAAIPADRRRDPRQAN